jgi:pimeloyl-ACP methyl ester carboxylesterase
MSPSGWREERVPVRGATLAVQRRGSGRPFYWGHGVTSSAAQEDRAGLRLWDRLRDGWEVLRVDARGHGASSPDTDPRGYRWPALAADLLALADANGHARLVAGGASMGAAVALHAAVAAPERIDALVLMIPPTAWATRPAQAARYRTDAGLVEREGLAALVAAEVGRAPIPLFAGLFDPEQMARERLAALDAATLPAILRGAADSDLPAPDVVARLRQPALILAWEGDDGHPLSTAERLAELLPHAALHVARRLADLGAWPQLVADFCSRTSPAR